MCTKDLMFYLFIKILNFCFFLPHFCVLSFCLSFFISSIGWKMLCVSSYRERRNVCSQQQQQRKKKKNYELNVFRMCLMKIIICIFHEHVIWYYFNVCIIPAWLAISASVSVSSQIRGKKATNSCWARARAHILLWITFIFHHQMLVPCVHSRAHAQPTSRTVCLSILHKHTHYKYGWKTKNKKINHIFNKWRPKKAKMAHSHYILGLASLVHAQLMTETETRLKYVN